MPGVKTTTVGSSQPAGAIERFDALPAAEFVDLARAQHAQDRERRREHPATEPDDAEDQRNGDRGHDDALHQVVGWHQDAVTLPNRRSRR